MQMYQVESFVYSEREKREQQQLDRTASLIGMAETVRAQSQADQTTATLGMIGGITNSLSGIAGGGGFGQALNKINLLTLKNGKRKFI